MKEYPDWREGIAQQIVELETQLEALDIQRRQMMGLIVLKHEMLTAPENLTNESTGV